MDNQFSPGRATSGRIRSEQKVTDTLMDVGISFLAVMKL